MKIEIPESARQLIEQFLTRFEPEIATLKSAAKRSASAHSRINATNDELASLRAIEIENLDDKSIHKRLVATERNRLLEQFIAQIDESLGDEKRNAAKLCHQGMEIFRGAASKTIEDNAKGNLVNALPAELKRDAGMVHDIWSRSAARREIGLFLNPPSVVLQDSPEVIAAECDRCIRLLRNLLQGEEISVELTAF